MNGEASYNSNIIERLEVSNSKEFSKLINFRKAYPRNQLLVNEEDIITPEKLTRWNHLTLIAPEVTKIGKGQIYLLVVANFPKALNPVEVIPSSDSGI